MHQHVDLLGSDNRRLKRTLAASQLQARIKELEGQTTRMELDAFKKDAEYRCEKEDAGERIRAMEGCVRLLEWAVEKEREEKEGLTEKLRLTEGRRLAEKEYGAELLGENARLKVDLEVARAFAHKWQFNPIKITKTK